MQTSITIVQLICKFCSIQYVFRQIRKWFNRACETAAANRVIIVGMQLKDTNRLTLLISLNLCVGLLAWSVLLFLTIATTPREIGAFGVTIWFLALLCGVVSGLSLARYGLGSRKVMSDKKLITFKQIWRTSGLLGLFLTVGLAMQSLRMLNLGDILLFLMTIAIIELYFRTKRT